MAEVRFDVAIVVDHILQRFCLSFVLVNKVKLNTVDC